MGWRQRNFVLEKQQPFLLLPPPSSSLANRFLLEEAWRWRRGGGRNEEEGGIWGERRMRMGCWVESESWKGDSTKNPPFFSFFPRYPSAPIGISNGSHSSSAILPPKEEEEMSVPLASLSKLSSLQSGHLSFLVLIFKRVEKQKAPLL